jgi:Chloroplast import apparatus Tic20-like
MTWRGSADAKDRFFAAIVYLIPLAYSLSFGRFVLQQFPILGQILYPILLPVVFIYSVLGSFAGIIIFFVLFFAVVRNERITHFIRFNTMQALLIDILLVLCGWVMRIIQGGLGTNNLIVETLYNVIFLATLVGSIYAIAHSALGRYAEIPTISEAAYTQVR